MIVGRCNILQFVKFPFLGAGQGRVSLGWPWYHWVLACAFGGAACILAIYGLYLVLDRRQHRQQQGRQIHLYQGLSLDIRVYFSLKSRALCASGGVHSGIVIIIITVLI